MAAPGAEVHADVQAQPGVELELAKVTAADADEEDEDADEEDADDADEELPAAAAAEVQGEVQVGPMAAAMLQRRADEAWEALRAAEANDEDGGGGAAAEVQGEVQGEDGVELAKVTAADADEEDADEEDADEEDEELPPAPEPLTTDDTVHAIKRMIVHLAKRKFANTWQLQEIRDCAQQMADEAYEEMARRDEEEEDEEDEDEDEDEVAEREEAESFEVRRHKCGLVWSADWKRRRWGKK